MIYLEAFFILTLMGKAIIGLDLLLHLAVLIFGTGFLVFQNNLFAGQMMFICWLPFSIYVTFSLAAYKDFPNTRQSLFSLLNFCFLGILVFLEQLVLIEFFISIILAELVSISLAVSYFFLFKKGLNDQSATDLFGKKGAILLAIFFTAIIYPYLGEAIIYIQSYGASIYLLIAFFMTLVLGSMRQIKSIEALVNKRNKNPDAVYQEMETALDRTRPMNFDTKVLLISLGVWFLGIGAIWTVYVHNA